MKECNQCGTVKHARLFREGRWKCITCESGRKRRSALRHRYGLTFEQFSTMLDEQQGLCAICLDEFDGEPHVDHDHVTGDVRGLLCGNCNHGLGHFKDSYYRLQRAIYYLKGRL